MNGCAQEEPRLIVVVSSGRLTRTGGSFNRPFALSGSSTYGGARPCNRKGWRSVCVLYSPTRPVRVSIRRAIVYSVIDALLCSVEAD